MATDPEQYHRIRLKVRETVQATGRTVNKVKRAWACRRCGCLVLDTKAHDARCVVFRLRDL